MKRKKSSKKETSVKIGKNEHKKQRKDDDKDKGRVEKEKVESEQCAVTE